MPQTQLFSFIVQLKLEKGCSCTIFQGDLRGVQGYLKFCHVMM
jgi:hypothetical protein